MSPQGQAPVGKPVVSSNIYTVLLAFAFCLVLVTTLLVAYKCYFQYNAFFTMP